MSLSVFGLDIGEWRGPSSSCWQSDMCPQLLLVTSDNKEEEFLNIPYKVEVEMQAMSPETGI